MRAAEWISEAPAQPPVVVVAVPSGAIVGTEPRTASVIVPPRCAASGLACAAGPCRAAEGCGAGWQAINPTVSTRTTQPAGAAHRRSSVTNGAPSATLVY